MDTQQEDRRAKRVQRVNHATRVEICSRDTAGAVFEAESVNLSGRGMCVRSDYQPEVLTPLVLRLQSGEDEAVVEGVVAWRDDGAEPLFGIKFTAVDSQSVRMLKGICLGTQDAAAKPVAPAPAQDHGLVEMGEGAPVRLHMDGLAAPMKARVFEESETTIYVGSQLEFLRLGRELQLEAVDGGGSGTVAIESVDVSIDPETQVPHLVLALRRGLAAEDATPGPSVIGDAGDRAVDDARHRPRYAGADEQGVEDPALELLEAEEMFKGRVEAWASQAGRAMRDTSGKVAALSGRLAHGINGFIQQAPKLVGGVSARRSAPTAKRRTTSPAQRASVAPGPRRGTRGNGRLSRGGEPRNRSAAPRSAEAQTPKRGRLIVAAAASVLVLGGGMAFQQLSGSDTSEAVGVAPAGSNMAPVASAAPAAFPAQEAFPEMQPLDTQEQLAEASNGVVAKVPLFGPQQMATTEAAPNAPARHPVVDEVGMAQDEVFARPKAVPLAKAVAAPAKASEAAASSSDKEWQIGKMVLPVVHRLRLDGAGTALQGKATANGFQVLIPGRKVMEKGNGIESRDDRITHVGISNDPAGARVTFRFKGDAPGYKARLRKDYVEFFINSANK